MAGVDQKAAELLIQKLITGIVDTAVKEWNYIYKFNDYVGSVKTKAEVLKGLEVDVEQVVNVAKWGGKVIGGADKRLITHADESKTESDKILEEAAKVNNGLWKGRLNVVGRFCLSRKAASLDTKITELIAQAQTYANVDHGEIPTAMLPAVKERNHDELQSRKILLDQVMKALKKEENYMIGIWGMAGVGKTALADEVKTRVLEGNGFDAAVKVVMTKQLNIPEIQDVIALSLGLKLEGTDEDGRARRLQSRLMDGSKNLVILDNVWEEVPLHRIGLPLHGMQKRCKVLITSRNHVILGAMGAKSNFEVKPLPPSEARQLFKEIACKIPEGNIVDKLTDECRGLPLAITTVASRLVNKDPQVWNYALRELKALIVKKEFTMEDHVHAPIEVSYNLLKNETDAQRLLLLCCLFPEEANIPIQKLIRYVKGLALLNVSDSLLETSCYVFALLDKLMNYSLISRGDKDTTVKINHVVRAVCLSISSKEDKNRLNVKHTPKLMKWPYNKEERQPYTGISLTFDDKMQELQLPDDIDYPELELLQLQFHSESLKLSDNNSAFKGMKEVRVLDFKRMTQWGSFIQIEALLPVLHILTNLRTLCIEFCNLNNGDLSLIESLKHLEVLSFFCSRDVTLPTQIQQLTNLKLLDLRCAGPLVIPSHVLSALKKLEELYLGNYDKWLSEGPVPRGRARDGIKITELSELPLLRVLQVRVKNPKFLLELNEEAWFERLTNFQIVAMRDEPIFHEYEIGKSMTLFNAKWMPFLDAKIHKLLKTTECLTLMSTTFRNLFVEFSALKSLELEEGDAVKFIMDTEDSAETLNKLNNLKIKGMKNLIAICDKELPSKSLVSLETVKLEKLPEMRYLWKALPDSECLGNLRFLDMSYCDAVTSIFPFSVAKGLVQLEKLDIMSCKKLKWIVSKEKDEKPSENIVLKKLSNLSLDDLQNFSSFFSDSVVKITSTAKGTSENAAEDDQKRGCSSWFGLKCCTSHTGEPSVSKERAFPISNVSDYCDQQDLENDVQTNQHNPLFNKLVELPTLKKLLIGSIDNIKHVVDDQTSTKAVAEIKIMVVTKCHNLLSLAESKHSVSSLRGLEQVKVENCDSMEALFSVGDCTETVLNKLATITLHKLKKLTKVSPMVLPKLVLPKISCFENLKSLEISDCESLEYIFSVSIAKMLGKLEDLKIRDCAMVKEVIDIRVGNKEEKTEFINFSCLRVMHFENLASMSSFSSSGNHEFNFPKLKDMLVRDCPSMLTFCMGEVRARLLYRVKAGDLPALEVPDEDALNKTIIRLHNINYNRLNLASGGDEEV